ncbi:hypothetical protein C0991_006749 [Blastosporella zonata]|nr:hypothetical protein C0991_006749 [Blastosporella zonata]
MNTKFTFPPPQAPVPRPAPPAATSGSPTDKRESNALRASVLDVALQLGIGNNSTVADWMFNNPLAEEDEEELRSPSLTHASTATSEESSSGRFPLTPPSSHTQPNFYSIQAKLFDAPENHIHFDDPAAKLPFRPHVGNGIPFPATPPAPQPLAPSRGKLKKKKADGHDSDGGYISDAVSKKDRKEREKEAKIRAKEEKLQEKKEKEEERKRKKSLAKAKKGDDKDGYTTGYDTDSKASKSSKKSKGKTTGDVGYETDSGYVSSASGKGKSKGRFFGLKSKQSKVELRQEEVPPLPTLEKEPPTLPIASKFATTIDTSPIASESLNSMISRALDVPFAATAPPPNPLPTPASTPAYHSATLATFPPNNRESLSSAESGGSSMSPSSASSHSYHPKRRGLQFLGHDLGHGGGSGSHSTITSASQVPLPPSSLNTPVSPTEGLPPILPPNTHLPSRDPGRVENSGGSSPAQHSPSFSLNSPPSAFPPVQHSSSSSLNSPPSAFTPQVFPTARNPSLSRGTSITGAQLHQVATSPPAQEPVLPPQPAVAPSPQPVRSSPTATTQPLRLSPSTQRLRLSPTTSTQPSLLSPPSATQPSRPPLPVPTDPSRSLPTTTTSPLRPRPRFAPTDGFGPRPTLTPSPIPPSPMTYLGSPSPGERPHLSIIPSSDYVVPSPRASPLPSPNVLAYYDIPPPSPPPSGPLPKVPPPGSFSPRSRTQERAAGGSQGSIQRGRESPFPKRSILSQGSPPGGGVGSGLGANVKVPRYRELYGLPLPREQNNRAVERREVDKARDWEGDQMSRARKGSDGSGGSGGSWEDGPSGYDEEEEEMRDVLDRFEEAHDAIGSALLGGKASDRSRSFEAIRNRITHRDDGNSDFDDDADEVARESSAEDGDDTNSRWSGSIYSRMSVLDPEQSEEARQRFIKRVEDLYGDGGREKNIPPVPKIPDAYVDAPGRSWNRF